MPRHPSGEDVLCSALARIGSAQSADELRQLQAVVLPLAMGLSIKETARVIGRSPSTTASMRAQMLDELRSGPKLLPKKRALRNRACFTIEQELSAIARIHGFYDLPGRRAKQLLEHELGRTISLATAYRILKRHGQSSDVESALDTSDPSSRDVDALLASLLGRTRDVGI